MRWIRARVAATPYLNAAFLLVRICLFGIVAAAIPPAHADVKSTMPDFYAEPGLHPFRDVVAFNETIDPFSGNLVLAFTDLVVPGNGGLDIAIRRVYNSNNVYYSRKTDLNIAPNLTQLLPRTPTGMGWSLHFGRVIKSYSGSPNPCAINTSPTDDSLDNAILELPDGRQQILFENSTSFSALFITKEQWIANCLTGGGGLLVISPEGVKYTMNYLKTGGGLYSTATTAAWYTTRIEDRNGNYLTINYNTTAAAPGYEAIISSITTAPSDGRTVNFTYTDTTNSSLIRLTSISANSQTWYYDYSAVTGTSGGYYLYRVRRPDGLAWNYTYWAKATSGTAGNRILRTVTHPYGATVTYDYGYVCFMGTTCNSTNNNFYSLVVASKVNGGRDVAPGTWTFSYAPSTTEDVTTVTFPGGSHVYRHFGSKMIIGGSTVCGTNIWKMGLLKEKSTYNGATLIKRETYTWDALYRLSTEEYVRPPYDGHDANHPRYADCDVYAPVLLSKQITLDGTTYTTNYSNFDASYNPRTVAETGQVSRTTSLTYFPRNAGQNIVRLVKDETISGQSTDKNIYRTFDANGNLKQLTRHGITEYYNYHPSGDLASRTNARNQTWYFNNYYRGIPQYEEHPEGVSIGRVVNNTGTIASETNGRGYTTSYTYNGMNQPTSITRPQGTGISIGWSSTGRTVTRGTYSQATTFDGFGRVSYINTNGITQDINYNALGYKSFQSYYSTTAGDSFSTDVLGRVTGVSHPDGTSRTISYLSANRVSIYNERQLTTTYSYRSFGDPDKADERVLMRIDAPEAISTVFTRDMVGRPESVTQGSVTRGYGYNANGCLSSETNPETGTTAYGRDGVCNMTSRQVGTSGTTTYTYDGLDRLTDITYPDSAVNASYGYDDNNNLTVVNSATARRTIGYDFNDNLTSETLVVGSLTFSAAYGYNALDYLASITYPSERIVSLAPDSLGRPTTVSPFITAVNYHPNGVPQNISYANGQTATTTLNARQWIEHLTAQKAGVGFAVDLTQGYDGVGNITGLTNALNAADSKTLGYDGVDRVTTAGTATIGYDTAGNIRTMSTSAGSLTYNYANNRLTSVSGSKNLSFGYDAYGNVTGTGLSTFLYDDASNMWYASWTGGYGFYYYDGKGLRVTKAANSKTTNYFHSITGNLLGEYNANGIWEKEYAYLGNKLVATAERIPAIPPSVPPTITVPTSSNGCSYAVLWGASTGTVTAYKLYESTSSSFETSTLVYSGTALSATISGRAAGTYYYRVRACNGLDCSGFRTGTNGVVVTIGPPDIPSSITVPSSGWLGNYTVSWGVSACNATSYELEESPNNFATTCVRGVCTINKTTVYVGPDLFKTFSSHSVGTYYYRVRACNSAGCSGYRTGANGVLVCVPTRFGQVCS
jgi:YD repeat-containing protein